MSSLMRSPSLTGGVFMGRRIGEAPGTVETRTWCAKPPARLWAFRSHGGLYDGGLALHQAALGVPDNREMAACATFATGSSDNSAPAARRPGRVESTKPGPKRRRTAP